MVYRKSYYSLLVDFKHKIKFKFKLIFQNYELYINFKVNVWQIISRNYWIVYCLFLFSFFVGFFFKWLTHKSNCEIAKLSRNLDWLIQPIYRMNFSLTTFLHTCENNIRKHFVIIAFCNLFVLRQNVIKLKYADRNRARLIKCFEQRI